MQIRHSLKHILFALAFSVSPISADDASEFNILPSSPLEADFFSNDIPASYLADAMDKTAVNYAILENGPTDELGADEVYIEYLPVIHPATLPDNNTPGNTADTSPAFAAGEFVNEDCTVIPENLVSIEPISPTILSRNTGVNPDETITAAKQSHPAGEFVTNESGGVTSELAGDAEYNAFPEGSFTLGYQIRYLNYSENSETCQILYNGIHGEYNQRFSNDLTLNVSASLLGGKVFEQDNGSIYTDAKLTLGRSFNLPDQNLTVTPYFGFSLRYTNNIFVGSNISERNNLQLYIPVGLSLNYQPEDRFEFNANLEVAPLALDQNWTTYRQGTDNTTANFNGLSALVQAGIEYAINEDLRLGIMPYYQYIYANQRSSSPLTTSNTHMVGLNAYLKF